ncbi:hydrolase [Acetobacter orleanensis]|uniref:Hydrolase n=1 Tax=Acetobacter orleanensis TaxID=104099 RepID=A0A4Y3TTF6_9PROT|nr:hydrolase [Acetobacter orleanensis]KXV66970.1 hydrolase [Acetobacter orleanensis]PCD78338.1 hydrolase [Acetobacter orleanensis]GAN67540.1 isochorismatase hydrolase [Acetobacter orleanensis JCM 7639]GBR28925.1 isochorismatase hydrolase [Acetobacter orleanensis NRIC 0473]GEB84065.1 hydrolase [Acetobacter orleanensis]
MISLPVSRTALVLIDLQKGIIGRPLAPFTGDTVVERSKKLASRFRAVGGLVILVNVAFAPDFADAVQTEIDRPIAPPPGGFSQDWTELVDGLAEPTDLLITKRQWGAFYGTDLDLQLRRRGIDTIVLGGIATNMGVESTARAAHEHGYGVVIAEDLTSTFSDDMQRFACDHIFPMLGRVTTSDLITLEA